MDPYAMSHLSMSKGIPTSHPFQTLLQNFPITTNMQPDSLHILLLPTSNGG